MELSYFLQESTKGALIRARFTKLKDRDAPTAFFFTWRGQLVTMNPADSVETVAVLWRTVTLLCIEYKKLSKVLSNRLLSSGR